MKLTRSIKEILSRHKGKVTITLDDISAELEEHTFALLLILLTMISALPIPAAGYSTPFGIIITILGIELLVKGNTLHLPKRLQKKKVPMKAFTTYSKTIIPFFTKVERFIHPRMSYLFSRPFSTVSYALILLCGLSMIIPLPLTNTIPSLAILLMAIGMLEDDGLFLLTGMFVAIFSFMVTFLIVTFGINIFDYLFTLVQNNFVFVVPIK
jgi:hypothetical protein